MNKRIIALALAMTFGLALGANIASAEDAQPVATVAAAAETTEEAETTLEEEKPAPKPDAEGTLSFGNLRGRMLENCYQLLALQENIDALESWDYERTKRELSDNMSKLADGMFVSIPAPTDPSSPTYMQDMIGSVVGNSLSSMATSSMMAQYNALDEQYRKLEKGEIQADNEGLARQLSNAQNQTVIAAESVYITVKSYEAQDEAIGRGLAQLDRSIRELELRHKLGQIPEMNVSDIKTLRAQTESQRESLRMGIEAYLLQLKAMVGEELGESITLEALPKVTEAQLAAMNLDQDYAKAQEVSYELYAAKKTYDDEKKAYNDALGKYGMSSKKNEWMQAKHTWQAAQYTYENTKLGFELKFRTLYARVKDAAQVLDAKRASLVNQEKSYQVSALKYQQGTISANELANAGDELAKVKDELASAERDLFTQYRSYQWAVEYGILNS